MLLIIYKCVTDNLYKDNNNEAIISMPRIISKQKHLNLCNNAINIKSLPSTYQLLLCKQEWIQFLEILKLKYDYDQEDDSRCI